MAAASRRSASPSTRCTPPPSALCRKTQEAGSRKREVERRHAQHPSRTYLVPLYLPQQREEEAAAARRVKKSVSKKVARAPTMPKLCSIPRTPTLKVLAAQQDLAIF
eukprot:scaffold27718_cov64-Phaeocystis_antarctica.AAC.2